jgi:hypothetical protein
MNLYFKYGVLKNACCSILILQYENLIIIKKLIPDYEALLQ